MNIPLFRFFLKNENIFAPDESVKREEFAKILCKALELKILKVEEIEPIFKDVDNNFKSVPGLEDIDVNADEVR